MMRNWAQETLNAAKDEHLTRRRVRQCTCEIYSHDDPDCELHHPEMIEDERERRLALQYFYIGHEAGYQHCVDMTRNGQ